MHDEYPSEPEPWVSYYLRSWVIAAASLVLVLVFVGYFFFLPSSSPTTPKRVSSGPARTSESGVDTARQGLSRQTDLKACRSALQQINAELGEKQAMRPPALTKEQKHWLRDNLGLNNEEMSEIESSHYTRLDNQHLFRCLLMRDAAKALEIKGVRGQAGGPAVREKPLDQAVRAFAWVMREVRLRPEAGDAVPPSFVLRRGWGSALERALVFLALLEQLGDPDAPQPEMLGFLLEIPPPLSSPGTGGDKAASPLVPGGDKGGGGKNLWTCGVVIGDGKDVYLFDPKLGLPLPGPNGEGVAALAQVREKEEVLAQLNVDAKNRYPVTKEQAQAAQVQLVCSLSALSPRMRYLQEKLLAPAVRVRLAGDAAKDVERIKTACSAAAAPPFVSPARGGDKGGVQVAKDNCTLLRRFLPAGEGGADAATRLQLFQLALVPWNALPAVFQSEAAFPRKSALGTQVYSLFAAYFVTPTMEAGYPRDLLLRGRYSSAVEKLVNEGAAWRSAVEQRANAADLPEQFQKWLDEATRVYANLVRAKSAQERAEAEKQVKKLWGDRGMPVHLFLSSAAAAARNPEVDYQLGLCSQEQAEQIQARLDLQAQVGVKPFPQDVKNAQSAWQHALYNWKSFEENYPAHPDVAAARRLRGWAEVKLGDRKAAVASWKNVAGCTNEIEKLAMLYLAQQGEKKHAGNKSKPQP